MPTVETGIVAGGVITTSYIARGSVVIFIVPLFVNNILAFYLIGRLSIIQIIFIE